MKKLFGNEMDVDVADSPVDYSTGSFISAFVFLVHVLVDVPWKQILKQNWMFTLINNQKTASMHTPLANIENQTDLNLLSFARLRAG